MSNIREKMERAIRDFFLGYDCEVVDMDKCIEYLEKENYLWEYDEIIKRFCECQEIICPTEYLDTNYIFSKVEDDYIDLGNQYLCECDFDGFDGIGDVIDKHIVVDKDKLNDLCVKYDKTYDEIFENIEKYSEEI